MVGRKDMMLLREFLHRLPLKSRKHIRKTIIYGSRVRGDNELLSDLDVVLLVDRKNRTLITELDDYLYEVMWEHDFKSIISLKFFTERDFFNAVRQGFSFYQNVLKEGVSILLVNE